MSLNPNPFSILLPTLDEPPLQVGSVIYKYCEFTNPSKYKYLLVVSTEPTLLVFMINSKINQFYLQKGLEHHHVLIPSRTHDFLNHDSYANCVEAHTAFEIEKIRTEIIDNYLQVFKGFITNDCLEKVYYTVKHSELIRLGQQRQILISIEEKLPYLTL